MIGVCTSVLLASLSCLSSALPSLGRESLPVMGKGRVCKYKTMVLEGQVLGWESERFRKLASLSWPPRTTLDLLVS